MRPSFWPNDGTVFYSAFCSCCAIGDLASAAYGMPWWMGCCCMNLPMARNTIRYQYRLKPTTDLGEFGEECMCPCACYFCFNLFTTVFPSSYIPNICMLMLTGLVISHLQDEVKSRSSSINKRYLMSDSLLVGSESPVWDNKEPIQVEMAAVHQPSAKREDGYATISVHEYDEQNSDQP